MTRKPTILGRGVREIRQPRQVEEPLKTGDPVMYRGEDAIVWGRTFGSRQDGAVTYDIRCGGVTHANVFRADLEPIENDEVAANDG